MKTAVFIFIITLLSFVIHEAAHLAAATALGYEATATINHVYPHGDVKRGDGLLIAAAGPIITVLIASVGAMLAISGRSLLALNFVVVSALHRLLAMIVSLGNPNDEARISLELGLGQWTLPAITVGFLAVLAVLSVRAVRPRASYWFLTWLGVSAGMTLAVLGENILPSVST